MLLAARGKWPNLQTKLALVFNTEKIESVYVT